MNVSPILNTSFKGFIVLQNKDDRYERAKFYQIDDLLGSIKSYNKKELPGKGWGCPVACSSYDGYTKVNTDYITEITPQKIHVENPEKMIFGTIDTTGTDYNKLLSAYSAASQNSKINVMV